MNVIRPISPRTDNGSRSWRCCVTRQKHSDAVMRPSSLPFGSAVCQFRSFCRSFVRNSVCAVLRKIYENLNMSVNLNIILGSSSRRDHDVTTSRRGAIQIHVYLYLYLIIIIIIIMVISASVSWTQALYKCCYYYYYCYYNYHKPGT